LASIEASAPLLLIELRTLPTKHNDPEWDGIIEICGPDTNGVHAKLHGFIEKCSGICLRHYFKVLFRVWNPFNLFDPQMVVAFDQKAVESDSDHPFDLLFASSF